MQRRSLLAAAALSLGGVLPGCTADAPSSTAGDGGSSRPERNSSGRPTNANAAGANASTAEATESSGGARNGTRETDADDGGKIVSSDRVDPRSPAEYDRTPIYEHPPHTEQVPDHLIDSSPAERIELGFGWDDRTGYSHDVVVRNVDGVPTVRVEIVDAMAEVTLHDERHDLGTDEILVFDLTEPSEYVVAVSVPRTDVGRRFSVHCGMFDCNSSRTVIALEGGEVIAGWGRTLMGCVSHFCDEHPALRSEYLQENATWRK